MVGILYEQIWFLQADFANGLVRRAAVEGLEAFVEVVGHEEVVDMAFECLGRGVMVELGGGFLNRAVLALHLVVGPGMIRFGQTLLNTMRDAHPL